MTVRELMEILKTCKPESVVHVYVEDANGLNEAGIEIELTRFKTTTIDGIVFYKWLEIEER